MSGPMSGESRPDGRPDPGVPSLDPEGADPPGGPFGSWGRLYATLAVYGVVTIVLLWWLTRTMNVTVGP